MASTATINGWAEELARSFLPSKISTSKTRKSVEHFTRAIRHHHHARTNQFEVQERLIGLEEKFLVFNYDELSDALRERRVLLGQHQERWLPDALDLLLKLAQDPLTSESLEKIAQLDRASPVVPTLKWSDIEADDPINRKDRIWRQPDYSDFSSDEDEFASSSNATSPGSQKQKRTSYVGSDNTAVLDTVFAGNADAGVVKVFGQSLLSKKRSDAVTISEIEAIREVLFMIQGYPTTLFLNDKACKIVDPRVSLSHIGTSSFHSILQSAIEVSTSLKKINVWLKQSQTLSMMQVLQDCVEELLASFNHEIAMLHTSFLPGSNGVASLLEVVDSLRGHAVPVQAVEQYLHSTQEKDEISSLDLLHNKLCQLEVSGIRSTFQVFLRILQAMLTAYVKPLDEWVSRGTLSEVNGLFFVKRVSDHKVKSTMWHTWYTSSKVGPRRPPAFLAGSAERILVGGKTQAFLSHLGLASTIPNAAPSLAQVIQEVCSSTTNSLLPFAPTLDAAIHQWLTTHLTASTHSLQINLQHRLGLSSTLCAFSHLFLSANGFITDTIDISMFSKLDSCNPSWNDRFFVSDLYEESFANVPEVEQDRIVIHVQPVSVQEMKSARHSVKILQNLAIDYVLPWPVANILLPDSLASYRRIALFLSQIRRARYVLENHALRALQPSSNFSSSVQVKDGKLIRPTRVAEGVFLSLHTFLAVLYTHLTTCVIGPLTSRFRADMASGRKTIDDMIALHAEYLTTMEVACLTGPTQKNLKVLKETVLEVCDLCVRSGFMVAGATRPGFDVDALVKTRTQVGKHVDLLITGLRGVARSNSGAGETSDMLELLAARLESCGFA